MWYSVGRQTGKGWRDAPSDIFRRRHGGGGPVPGGEVPGAAVRRDHPGRPDHRDGGLCGHAYNYRKTERTRTLFAPPGTAYVYLIYGMHCCLNFVTEPEGEPAAVLIRGLSPRYNQDIIAENRFHCKWEDTTAYQRKNFLNGPGKVCAGMNISRALNGLPHGSEELFVCGSLAELGLPAPEGDRQPLDIKAGKRIGIDYAEEAVHFPWRFYL